MRKVDNKSVSLKSDSKLDSKSLYRNLPSVDEVLRLAEVAELAALEGASPVLEAAREVLAQIRSEIGAGRLDEAGMKLAISGISDAVKRRLQQTFAPSLRTVINATGVVLHTNLGRAPLSQAAIARIAETAGTYSNLEFDVEAGSRGKRDVHVQKLFSRLLNMEAGRHVQTVVVNNCAAAVMLALNTLAEGGEVIVSRGELVEIGGSFRVPDVMAKSNAVLREVGTTNRTRIGDYERAINDKTRLLLRVHRSNFAIVGFTEQPSIEELVALGKKHKVAVMEDLGNGALIDLRSIGINNETGVAESIRAGVDVVTYSGDKLLGGPQAGILSGGAEYIQKIRQNPMFRALRVDKLTYAALEAVLSDYVRGNHDAIPALRIMRLPATEIRGRAEAVCDRLSTKGKIKAEIVAAESVIGGGTAPTATLPTFVIAMTHAELSADEFAKKLRSSTQHPPIVGRVEEGRVLLDLRTVFPEQDSVVTDALFTLSR
jgi:L-seryl-tRNA(Ser) seleniumtransferase